MDTSAMLTEAFYLVQQDLYQHLEQAEYLAQDDWNDEQVELARTLLPELCEVIRGVIAAHRPDSGGACGTCGHKWPCSVVILIHGLVKDPKFHFVRLLQDRRY